MIFFDNIQGEKSKVKCEKDKIILNINQGYDKIDGRAIEELISSLKYVVSKCNKKQTIFLRIHGKEFADDSSIVFLEYSIKTLIDSHFLKIHIHLFNLSIESYNYELYYKSILNKVLCLDKNAVYNKITKINNGVNNRTHVNRCIHEGKLNVNQFINIFEKIYIREISDFNNVILHENDALRLTVCNDVSNKWTSSLGSLVKKYLCLMGIFSEDFINSTVCIICEIIDNTLSHTMSESIFSMKTCSLTKDGVEKYMLSIVFLNFSSDLLYSRLKNRFEENKLIGHTHELINEAYENHEKYIEENTIYDLDSFFLISAFQKGITTRDNRLRNSGRGLCNFIREIMDKAEFQCCYVYSGNTVLYLNDSSLLTINDEGQIGFNKYNDYINFPPDMNFLNKSSYHINGTLYNLMLVYDRSEIND